MHSFRLGASVCTRSSSSTGVLEICGTKIYASLHLTTRRTDMPTLTRWPPRFRQALRYGCFEVDKKRKENTGLRKVLRARARFCAGRSSLCTLASNTLTRERSVREWAADAGRVAALHKLMHLRAIFGPAQRARSSLCLSATCSHLCSCEGPPSGSGPHRVPSSCI